MRTGSDPRLAVELAGRMLCPSVLDEGLRSGVFLVRQSEAERWGTFARALVAELQRLGAVVMYVDLAERGPKAIDTLLQELQSKYSALREQLSPADPVTRGATGEETLSDVINSIIDLSRSDLVLICDHVSQLKSQPGGHVLKALKAARDAVCVRADGGRHFFLVAADCDTSAVNELAREPAHAFLGATVLDLTGR